MIGRKIAIFGMVLLMGLSFAPNGVPEYLLNQYERAECIRYAAGHFAYDVEYTFQGEGAEDLFDEISDALPSMWSNMHHGSYTAALAEYANIVSLFNQMRVLWLQYGIGYVLGGDATMSELMHQMSLYYEDMFTCFVEGPVEP